MKDDYENNDLKKKIVKTEKEIMQGLGYNQVFDCGNIKLDWFSNTDSSS